MNYATTVLADSPVAFYQLNETSGASAADSTGNGYTATLAGSVTFNQIAISNDTQPSILFSGNASLDLPDAFPEKNFTQISVEYWINLVDGSGWQHIALTYDGTQTLTYINGIVTATGSNSPIQLYSSFGWTGTFQQALLKYVAVYNYALFPTEIQRHASAFPYQAVAPVTGSFVTRIGSKLYLNRKPFRFGGINAYDLSFKNGDSSVSNVSAFAVSDILTAAKDMGVTVIRVKDFGISQGHSGTFEPTPGVFDNSSTGPTQVWDYALWQAGLAGIKLIPMMTDENTDLTGIGTVGVFCTWAGVPITYDNFYTNLTVIQYYKEYLYNFINHVNIYTGVAYKNDPAIFAVETGNELYGENGSANCAYWVNIISTYFKTIDSNHLFLDGTWQTFPLNVALPNVDLLNDHFYPMDTTRLQNNINICRANNKPFIVGEFNWAQDSIAKLPDFLSMIEANQDVVCGDLAWNLDWRSLNGSWHNFAGNQGTLDIWYPGGVGDKGITPYDDKAARQQILRAHNYKVRGITLPKHIAISQPLITSITTSGGHNVLSWRGVAGAATYTLESLHTNRWATVISGLTDFLCPYTDTTQASGNVWYRIRAFNLDGVPGPYSPIASSGQRSTYIGQDDFTKRFVPALYTTWDYASDGQKWTTVTGAPVLSLTGTSGTITSSTGAQTIIMRLGTNTGTIMEGIVRWSVVVTADTPAIYLRINDSTHYYSLGVLGTMLTIGKKSGGSFTSLATASVLAPGIGNHYWFHFKVNGTALTGKMWPDGAPEPSAWMVSATDTSITSGGIGLGAVPTTTSPVTFDHFNVVQPQNAPPVALVSTSVRR